MMRGPPVELVGLNGERFRFAFQESETPQAGSCGAGDFAVGTSCAVDGFACEVVTWVERTAWNRFVSDLVTLERRRAGRACLESMSPRELNVTLALPKGARALCLDWSVATQNGLRTAPLDVSGVAVDVGLLAAFVSGVQWIAPA